MTKHDFVLHYVLKNYDLSQKEDYLEIIIQKGKELFDLTISYMDKEI
jgi:hypothetical protein